MQDQELARIEALLRIADLTVGLSGRGLGDRATLGAVRRVALRRLGEIARGDPELAAVVKELEDDA